MMYQAFDAIIDQSGNIQIDEPVKLPPGCRAIVIVLDDVAISDTALLGEDSLARSWNRPEEDAAWAYLQTDGRQQNTPPKSL